MLACARIGAPGRLRRGFSADALASLSTTRRLLVITADGGWRRGKAVNRRAYRDRNDLDRQSALVVRRVGDQGEPIEMKAGRDVWWHDIVERQSEVAPPVSVDSEHMLYLLYTSGTTAKPKGIMHTTAGYLLGTSYTHQMIFDVKPDDVYWCAADIGWVTGHSYRLQPAGQRTTSVMYEGAPDTPGGTAGGRSSRITRSLSCIPAPTAIRAFL